MKGNCSPGKYIKTVNEKNYSEAVICILYIISHFIHSSANIYSKYLFVNTPKKLDC